MAVMITDATKEVVPFDSDDAMRVGEGCFYLDVIVWLNGDRIQLGDRVSFGHGCYVNGYGGLVIGDDCGFGPYVMIHTANHRTDQVTVPIRDQGWEAGPVEIGADCFVGMGSSIVPGVRIGSGTVVGAGSVVAKDLPSDWVAAGNPARPIRRRR